MSAQQSTIDHARIAAQAIADKLGSDIIAIDMTGQLILSDLFLIATGANERQVDAIHDSVFEKLQEVGEKPLRIEKTANWILMDYGDLVVHIQTQEVRNFYMLERLWNDSPRITLNISEER
jgi:ribosome-associated protein